jgi:hypothetical protein
MTRQNFVCDAGRIGQITTTDEGYLKGEARVTRTGIFNYLMDDSVKRILRHPDDVFDSNSLDSMKMIPMTNNHPIGSFVDSNNAQKESVGHVGENIRADGKYLTAPVVITDQETIDLIKAGKHQLSLGYSINLDNASGIYDGSKYDGRQRNIKYNHLAIVQRGRAGKEASLQLTDHSDIDAIEVSDDYFEKFENSETKNEVKRMRKITLDSDIEYDAAPEVKVAFEQLKKSEHDLLVKIKDSETQIADLKSKHDKLEGERDALDKKVKTLDDNSEVINAATKKRVNLISQATNIVSDELKDKLFELDDIEIKKEVIKTLSSEIKLDDRNSDYIDACFDTLIAMNAKSNKQNVKNRSKVLGDTAISKSNVIDAEDSRKKMIEGQRNNWKRKGDK